MLPAIILAAVALPLNAAEPTAAPSGSFASPPPRMIELLRQQHHTGDWLYVTTPAGRYEIRVSGIHEGGLAGITARRGTPPASEIPWSNIARIEQRTSHFRAGQVVGLVAGAIAGGYLGAAIGNSGHGDAGAWTGLTAGSVAGAWAGGMAGDRFESSRAIYEGQTAGGEPVAISTIDSRQAVEEFRKSASESDVLRLRGSFGEFTGKASHIGPDGFSGLVRDPQDMAFKPPQEPISWSRVSSVERRGSAAGRYAGIGALIGAGIVGTLAGSVSAGLGSDDKDILGAVLAGAGVGGLAGAGAGAAIGSGVPKWHLVYQMPLVAENSGAR